MSRKKLTQFIIISGPIHKNMETNSKKTDRELSRQTDDKIGSAKIFLHKHGLAPNVYNLLGLVGAVFLEDFEEIDEGLLADIEKHVRDPNFFGGEMSKSERNKYFANEQKDASNFAFTILDRRKLQRVADEARKYREDLATFSAAQAKTVGKVERKRKIVSSR